MIRTASLVTHLVNLAARLRDPLRLAVALRAQYPDWGARASFTAYGLRNLLDHLGWELDATLPERYEAYAVELAALHPTPLWTLRREQFRRLFAAIEQPRPLVLRRSASAAGVDRELGALLVACANHGCTLADVRNLAALELGLPRAGLVRPHDLADEALPTALSPWRGRLGGLDVGAYVDLLEHDDREHHPDVMRAATLRDLAALGRATIPSPEQRLEASLAELAEPDDEPDEALGVTLPSRSLQA